MDLKEWIDETGFSMTALAKISDLPKSTISNLCNGHVPTLKIVKKLVKATYFFDNPITYDMFPVVYLRGDNRYLPIENAIQLKEKGPR